MADEPIEGQEPEPTPSEPDTFDREYVEKLRKEAASYRTKLKELEPLAQKAQELEEQGKSELEKLTGKLTDTEQKLTSTEARVLRMEVALDKAPDGMSIAQVRKLANRLQGATREELETDADELFADFVSEPPKSPPGDLPKQKLRQTNGSEPVPLDGEAIADRILKANRVI